MKSEVKQWLSEPVGNTENANTPEILRNGRTGSNGAKQTTYTLKNTSYHNLEVIVRCRYISDNLSLGAIVFLIISYFIASKQDHSSYKRHCTNTCIQQDSFGSLKS